MARARSFVSSVLCVKPSCFGVSRMTIRIYNSLKKSKQDLIPLDGKTVKMYSCGVTVYDRCHIGHARSLYVFDVIKRYMRHQGLSVKFVRNITDIDDKIIKRANELGIPWDKLVADNVQYYYDDLKALGIDKADSEPRATNFIPQIIRFVEELIQKGFAYVVDGSVYYNVRQFKEYGKLSKQSIEFMEEAVRIDQDKNKKDALDFALWKKSKEGEPYWESPWGRGRPGWHIECSCMSLNELNCQTLDIHAGGRDLIFPHHENELAQSESLTGKPFANAWIHHGLLTINNQKMAKSLGNFITVKDALDKYSVDQLKMFFLFSHYSSPIDFSDDKMQDAYKALQRFDILFWKASEILKNKDIHRRVSADFIENHKQKFFEAMDDDFNTPKAIATLFDFLNDTNKFIDGFKGKDNYDEVIFSAVDTIESLCREIFGLFLKEKTKAIGQEEESLLNDRVQARKNKDFKRSDELRGLLKEKGIIVEDSKDGQTWRWA